MLWLLLYKIPWGLPITNIAMHQAYYEAISSTKCSVIVMNMNILATSQYWVKYKNMLGYTYMRTYTFIHTAHAAAWLAYIQ